MSDSPIVAALLRERGMCEQRGLTARVALIDAELDKQGYRAPKAPAGPAPTDDGPQGRKARPVHRTSKGE